jgi:site-specific recombinase XerC
MRLRVYGPDAPMAYLGDEPIQDLRRADLQDLIARLIADGSAPRTIEATIIPLRAIFAHEVRRDRLKTSPTRRRPRFSGRRRPNRLRRSG